MVKQILVLGYFDHLNWGDDVFKFVFENYIFNTDEFNLTVKDLDTVRVITKENIKYDYVIFGPGDIINTYYFNNDVLADIQKTFSKTPLIFYGVGMSFPSLLPLMDVGDIFFMRNRNDYDIVKFRYGSNYTYYTPDPVYHLLNHELLKTYVNNKIEVFNVGICIPYPMFLDGKNMKQMDILVKIIKNLVVDYNVTIIPFDTSNNKDNSDLLLVDKLETILGEGICKYVKTTSSTSEMIECFKSMDFLVASRFHSVILSILTETPFVSYYTTTKIENMIKELPGNFKQVFIKDLELFDDAFAYVKSNYVDLKKQLRAYKNDVFSILQRSTETFLKLFNNTSIVRSSPPQYISESSKSNIINETIENVLCMSKQKKQTRRVLAGTPLNKIILKRRRDDSTLQKRVAEEVLWSITQDPHGPYYYGLYENGHKSDLVSQLDWIINDYYLRFKHRSFIEDKVTVINKNFQELHRSGWQYIVDNIVSEINNTMLIKKELIIDTYVDKTFHWNLQFYETKDVIPYKRDWIGFIHHTFSSYNNAYNCEVLLDNKLFKQSLKHCKCLIVMSEYLKTQIEERIGVDTVRIEVVYHPTEEGCKMFSWDAFMTTEEKQIVQIGNWLRNVFSIYSLDLPKNSIITKKSVLKNKNSDSYFLPDDFFDELIRKNKGDGIVDMCRIAFENMHVKGMYQHIQQLEDSVTTLEYLDNEKYDELLSRNIVFINLIDASAVNTVVECVMRNTPILVNPIPAVVEFIGEDYPLYYNSLYEASKILEDKDIIFKGYEYLKNKDKTRFTIGTFIERMKSIVTSL